MAKSNTDTFGTFLEAMHAKRASDTQTDDDRALLLLKVLARHAGSLRADDLLSRSELDIQGFARALKACRDAGFITATGPASDCLELTPSGARVASPTSGTP